MRRVQGSRRLVRYRRLHFCDDSATIYAPEFKSFVGTASAGRSSSPPLVEKSDMRGQYFRLETPTLDMSKHVRPKTSRKLKTPVKVGQPSPKSKGRKDETKEVTSAGPGVS